MLFRSNLKELFCRTNLLSELNVTQNSNLERLDCSENQLTGINLSENPNLIFIQCFYNQIENLDVSNNPNLYYIWCSNNQLTNIDVTQNSLLEWLGISFNEFTSIDISQNPLIEILSVGNNQLTSLDLTQNIYLKSFSCNNNNITHLDVSNSLNLDSIDCFDNQLVYLNINNGNNENIWRMFAYNNTNLECIQVDDINYANSQICDEPNGNGWCKDETATYSEFCELGTEDFTKTDFQLFPNPAGNLLNIESRENIENVKIYSSQGILLKEVFSKSIDVSQLSAGMYFAQITFAGKTFTKKFIKQ